MVLLVERELAAAVGRVHRGRRGRARAAAQVGDLGRRREQDPAGRARGWRRRSRRPRCRGSSARRAARPPRRRARRTSRQAPLTQSTNCSRRVARSTQRATGATPRVVERTERLLPQLGRAARSSARTTAPAGPPRRPAAARRPPRAGCARSRSHQAVDRAGRHERVAVEQQDQLAARSRGCRRCWPRAKPALRAVRDHLHRRPPRADRRRRCRRSRRCRRR